MPDNKIKELLRKYIEGRATPGEEKVVDDWYDSLTGSKGQVRLSDSERSNLRNLYWDSLKTKVNRSGAKSKKLWPSVMGLAAAITVILMVSVYLVPSYLHDSDLLREDTSLTIKEIDNDTQVPRQVSLADGSRVTLFPGSKLQFSDEFNLNERKVILSGEAFFDISHNEAKPFYVFANEVVTQVLGTSFSVTAYPEDVEITVAVKTGKVSVYTDPEKNHQSAEDKLILTPNQQAVYTRSSKKVSRMLIKDPQVIIPEEEVRKIRFEGVPVSEIFNALEKMYGVEIVFEEEIFSKCSITTSVSEKDLYERIDVICEITGATYRIENTRILISGTGCN